MNYMNFIFIGLLLREALDRLCVRLNMYLVVQVTMHVCKQTHGKQRTTAVAYMLLACSISDLHWKYTFAPPRTFRKCE